MLAKEHKGNEYLMLGGNNLVKKYENAYAKLSI